MSDDETTLAELRQIVRGFVDEREWQKFHSPKNLSMALAIEAAELMEHFQWISMDDSRQVGEDPDKLHAVGEELADVLKKMGKLQEARGVRGGLRPSGSSDGH